MPEAICDTTGATTEREAWREVEGAAGPASAAWLSLSCCEMAARDLRAVGGVLAHVASSDAAPEEGELDLLARVTAEAAEAVGAAFRTATALLSPLSQAERADAAEAEDGPPPPPLPEPSWLPAARAEGARLAAEGLHGRELGYLHGDVRLVRWLAARLADAEGAEAGARLLALAGIAAEDAPR